MSDYEELYEDVMFEKPRGERRWLGREHHRGKEQLHNAVKDRTFIEKTVSSAEPLSKKATQKVGDSTKDELELNVVYSLDKKNRWKDANTITLLGAAPEDVRAEVVEKNALEQYGFLYPNKSTFAVHTKKVNLDDAPGEFEVRSVTSSGKGQDYSNFLPATREFKEEVKKEEQPTVSYNIYKTHPSQDAVGGQMFKAKVVSKSGKHRGNKKVDIDVYEAEDEEFDEEDDEYECENSFGRRGGSPVELSDFFVENREKQAHRSKRKESEMSFEIIDAETLRPEPEYTDLLDIHTFLKREGYTFEEADITFHNQKDSLEHQMRLLKEEKGLEVKDLRERQFLVDISKWCRLNAEKDGETTAVIIFTHLEKNQYNVILNSTIPCHPSKRGADYLRNQISSAMTMCEAISRITTEMMTRRKVVEAMKFSSLFYDRKSLTEQINDSYEWENQMLEMQWPNRHHHATWANSQELSTVGGRLEWDDLCAMVRKESRAKTCYTSGEPCGVCSRVKRDHELFLVENESRVKCKDCLREEFYRELRARRVPIDLQTDTADELEYLPTFIPLTVLNLYIRMVSEQIYKDLGAVGDFEKCPSCKSAVYFEDVPGEKEKKTQNRSCPCGYSWCRHCERVPHWPMECGDFSEWEEKWFLRYSIMHAQGTGTETLLQMTCSCAKSVYNVLLPLDFAQCPKCKTHVNMNTMNTVWRHYFFPYYPRFRKLVEQGHYNVGHDYDQTTYVPRAKVYTSLAKIPGIRASVMETCGAARDVRYDLNSRNRAVNREHNLIRKNILEKETVENLFGTITYLVENVTAWMYVTNQYDRNVKMTLESMMENRKELMDLLEGDEQNGLKECIGRIRREIDTVVAAVEKKLESLDLSNNVRK
ncbi:unnamed protein product [Caenorhabditis sp. 36 PRJEB53466]|nr:unnamed protein product [Caenorhabditis sp. 36 PRJEB53466]